MALIADSARSCSLVFKSALRRALPYAAVVALLLAPMLPTADATGDRACCDTSTGTCFDDDIDSGSECLDPFTALPDGTTCAADCDCPGVEDCSDCMSKQSGNEAEFEFQLVGGSGVFDGTNTTFTYSVCSLGGAALSHFVIGLDAECCANIDSTSGGSSTGSCDLDPTTGLFGLKFDIAGAPPACSGPCEATGDLFTVTLAGEVPTSSCVKIANKADGDEDTSTGCILGPNCQDPCDPPPNCTGFDDECNTHSCDPAGAEGNCDIITPEPTKTVCDDTSSGPCDAPDFCDGAGNCVPTFQPSTTVCRAGSGDLCDPTEFCTGSSVDCPADIVAPATTICNPGSGDLCDVPESCTGVPGDACPDDTIAPPTTICRPGSGDLCDPDESCTGVADAACPADVVSPATTICNPGSGDLCDPDESCTGLAGDACPADSIASATTICRPGSGDLCDPDESCTGVADDPCPADDVAPATTICNPGSGDLCDPDESCTGTAGDACPADTIASATTICRPGSGDICDPDESCTGVADAACPADVVASATTICNGGSGDLCDPDESCTGLAGAAGSVTV